jgi:hypothetical protein
MPGTPPAIAAAQSSAEAEAPDAVSIATVRLVIVAVRPGSAIVAPIGAVV